MKAFLENISMRQKFFFLNALFGVVFIAMAAVVLISQAHLNRSAAKIEISDQFKLDLSSLRVSVNAMRGEVFVNLLADRQSMSNEVEESKNGYQLHRSALKNLEEQLGNIQASLEDNRLSESLQRVMSAVTNLNALTDSYMGLSRSHILNDSTRQIEIHKVMKEYVPLFAAFREAITSSYKLVDEIRGSSRDGYAQTMQQRNVLLVGFFCAGIIVALTLSLYLGKIISDPILRTKSALEKISSGEVPVVEVSSGKDETASMLQSLRLLVTNLNNLKTFTSEVGRGNFETQVVLFENKGAIAEALLAMRDNLKAAAFKESQSKRVSQGLAEAGKLLSVKYENSTILYDTLIRFVVKFLSATQGSFFVTNDTEESAQLNLVACYAYDRKKYLQKSIAIGEGLAGQVCLEREILYMTDIPQHYLKITSGLGEANPRCLAIVPLINDNVVQGVLELASFDAFDTYQLEFLKQFSDLAASHIAREKFNSKMQHLLEISQQRTEELRATEEELRQSMEELTATQEELQRRLNETEPLHSVKVA